MTSAINTSSVTPSITKAFADHAPQETQLGVALAGLLSSKHGQFVQDRTSRTLFFLVRASGQLMSVDNDNADFRCLLGVVAGYPVPVKTLKALVDFAHTLSVQTDVRRIGWCNRQTSTAYIYSQGREVFAVSASDIRIINNGDESVYFLREELATPFRLVETITTSDRLEMLLRSLVNPANGLTSPEQAYFLLDYWFCCQFLKPLVATFPALVLVGPAGSNKTLLAEMLGQLLTGDSATVVSSKSDASKFNEASISHGYLLLDDLTDMPAWLPEQIEAIVNNGALSVSSGRSSTRHKLDCRLVITTRDIPQDSLRKFGHLLPVELSPFASTVFKSKVVHDVAANRDEIMTSVLLRIQEILQAHKEPGADYTGPYQAADLANVVVRHARVFQPGRENVVADALKRLATVNSRAMTTPGQQLIRILEIWVTENQGRPVTPPKLRKELLQVAEKQDLELDLPCRLGHLLNKMLPELKRIYRVTKQEIGSRYKQLTFWHQVPSDSDPAGK